MDKKTAIVVSVMLMATILVTPLTVYAGIPNDGTTASFLSLNLTADSDIVIATIDLSPIGGHAMYVLTYYYDALFGCNITTTCNPGTYNLTVNVTDVEGNSNNTVNITIAVSSYLYGAPDITSWYPEETEIYDSEGATRTFNVTVNQTVNVSWYLNNLLLFTNQSVKDAKYSLHVDVPGENNVSAVAGNPNGTDMQTWIWHVAEPQTCNMSLTTGWNLISVPLNLISWELGEESVIGNPLSVTPKNSLASIYRYNTTSGLFDKCDYIEDWGWSPATGSVRFTDLEPGRGYWVWAMDDSTLTFTGTAPSDQEISLDADWNLIGWYSTSEALLGEESVVGNPLNVTPRNSLTSIYRYDTTSGLFEKGDYIEDWGWCPATGAESFTVLEPGRGYWVKAKNACEWWHVV